MFTSIGPAVNVLNELFELDPCALHCLQAHRVPCNRALADHPTVQVMANEVIPVTKARPDNFIVGVLGLINGAMTAATGEVVATRWTHRRDKPELWYFDGFCVYESEDRKHDIPEVRMPEGPWEAALAALILAMKVDAVATVCVMRAEVPCVPELLSHPMINLPTTFRSVMGTTLLNAVLQSVFGRSVQLMPNGAQLCEREA